MIDKFFGNQIGWFRINGYGIFWKNTRCHPLLFSERYGFKAGVIIFGWWFNIVTPKDWTFHG